MPLFRKPFFRPSRGLWYVEVTRGKQVNLGKDKDAAFARYHELMGRRGTPAAAAPATTAAPLTTFRAPATATAVRTVDGR